MKLNWGTGIALAYGSFAIVMVGLALQTTKHDVGLVKKDYYDDDINYQVHYDKMKNARDLKTDLVIKLDSMGKNIVLQFPADLPQPTGKVLLFRPSQTGVDESIEIKADTQNEQLLSTESLKSGLWKIKVDWNVAGKDYYKEQGLVLN
jgi:hypothetical protein